MMTIHIQELRFKSIIGILEHERLTPQEVIIDLELDYEYINSYINYADIATLIESTMQERKYELIETALNELLTLISSNFKQVKRLMLKITKPDILPACRVSVSKVKIY